MKTRAGDMIKNRFYSSLKKGVINNKSLWKKRKRTTSKFKSYQIYNNLFENNSKIKTQELSDEVDNSLALEKKDEKKDILSYSNKENINYLNLSNTINIAVFVKYEKNGKFLKKILFKL